MSTLSILAGQASDKGLKAVNEDCCGIRVPSTDLLNTKGISLIVADGVSSSSGGREASETCVRAFMHDYYSTPETWTVKTSAQKVLGAINRWLYGQGARYDHSGQGMLTTMSTLVLKSTTAHIFHVGDSRIYRLRNNDFERLTRDHKTWAGAERSFLARAMGADLNIEIDYRKVSLQKQDLYFLATDGVFDFVHAKDIVRLLQGNRDNPDKAAREIMSLALTNGSNDNATCQVCIIEQLPDEQDESFYQKLIELPFPPPLSSGHVIDDLLIIRELHASKRSQVYLVQNKKNNEQVVMKTPSVNFDDNADYIEAFLNEEWIGKRINSPHVLKIVDPLHQRRFLYYLTEYVDGQSLRQWMNDHPQPDLQEVRNIIQQIIRGVRCFQRLEMVHQDLKPENILIDRNGTVKIIDFGSTKIAGIEETHQPFEQNFPIATIDYAAPELFEGVPGTHLSDIFSIGVLCYEMLTGHLPYGKPLSLRNLKRVNYVPAKYHNPTIPAWVDAALEKCVRIKANRRYATLSEFQMDISKPNHALIKQDHQALIEKHPMLFWKSVALIQFVIILLLLFALLR